MAPARRSFEARVSQSRSRIIGLPRATTAPLIRTASSADPPFAIISPRPAGKLSRRKFHGQYRRACAAGLAVRSITRSAGRRSAGHDPSRAKARMCSPARAGKQASIAITAFSQRAAGTVPWCVLNRNDWPGRCHLAARRLANGGTGVRSMTEQESQRKHQPRSGDVPSFLAAGSPCSRRTDLGDPSLVV